jgi:hypothetical protein
MLDAEAYKTAQETRDVFKEYKEKQDRLDLKMSEWEEAVNKHDVLSSQ